MRIFISIISILIFLNLNLNANDWNTTCDNTNTCRMEGYAEDWDNPFSILFTREAGQNSQIIAHINFYLSNENNENEHLTMLIDNKNYKIETSTELSKEQTNTILEALILNKTIKFYFTDKYEWTLSSENAIEAIKDMDKFQQRINTIGAIYKKGSKNEDNVLPKKAPPTIYAPKINLEDITNNYLPKKEKEIIFNLINDGNCDKDIQIDEMNIYKIEKNKAIVSKPCFSGAYNFTFGFWLINLKTPFNAIFIDDASDEPYIDENGVLRIFSSLKGRGIGDCWDQKELVWNGLEFVESYKGNSGLCRGFAGGAWTIDEYVTNVELKQ